MTVTLRKIAEALNLSTATVSKVLSKNDHDISDQTRQRVLEKAHELNYSVNVIAQSMRINQTKSIGLILPDIKNYFFTDIATSIENELINRGYLPYYCNTYESFEREVLQIKYLLSKRVDGIIIAGTNMRNINRESQIHFNCPIIAIDRQLNYEGISSMIASDNLGGAFQAVDYLCKSGHRNIMYISGPASTNTTKERKRGYLKALAKYGIAARPYYIRHGDYTAEYGYHTVMYQSIPKEVTAILCGNDLIAIGVIKALSEREIRVPEDVSIIGYDDTEIASLFSPTLTTVRQPSSWIGQFAVAAFFNCVNNVAVEPNIVLNQELIVRKSTRALN